MAKALSIEPVERSDSRVTRLALRWMLILATALLILPPVSGTAPGRFDTYLILAFALSNAALSFVPADRLRSRYLEYLTVIADTFLVSLAMFHARLDAAHLPLVFFLTLLLAALGPDLPRIVAGTTLLAGFYVYMTGRSDVSLAALFLRVPFLYVVGLYYGHLVHAVRRDQARARRLEQDRREMRTFLEVTAAATSTLDLHQVLFVVVRKVAELTSALRCSILTVDDRNRTGRVLASSDDPAVDGLVIDLGKYPEVWRAIETRRPVVINDVGEEAFLREVRPKLDALGFHSILVLPLLHRNALLGMLLLRAARTDRYFSEEEITACQIVANASANALKNAMLYEQASAAARSHKETADKLQSILDQFPDLIYTADVEGRLTEFSRGGEALLGYTRDAALGLDEGGLFADGAARERLRSVARDGRSIRNYETVVRGRDGVLKDVLTAAAPLRDSAGRVIGSVGIIKNISDLKAAQRHLLQAEKLSAVGEVVSGVAHELNNPLAGVLGFAQLLMAETIEPQRRRSVERIFESALRCQKIVQNLLAFSRQYPAEKRHLGLNGIIEKTLDLKAYQLRVNNIRVVKDLDPALPKTMLDFNQIQQVLLNVINNAQYSMSRHRGQGTLTVTTRLRDGAILAEIRDDGPGIPGAILGKVFDPFFTTKPVGEGTGLGLSVSYGIVKSHGGRIWAESDSSRGTSFSIELPVREDERAGSGPPAESLVPGPARPLRILGIDDEAVILDLLVDALGREGHRVDTASSAHEALDKLGKGTYDVLVCDLKMPEVDGRELYETIRRRWPEMAERVIFASGDTVHPDTRRFVERSGRPCVDKPFRLEDLSAAITAVAGGESRGGASAARR